MKNRFDSIKPRPIILLVGESGSGKTTFAEYLCENWGLKQLQSYTTRKPRYDGETGHTFISKEEAEDMMLHKHIVASTVFDGETYFCTLDQVNESDIYVIDPKGAWVFLRNYRGRKMPYVVFLEAPEDVRAWRMQNRGDKPKDIRRRIEHDRDTFAEFHTFDSQQDLTIKSTHSLKRMGRELMFYLRFATWCINRR